MQQQRQNLPDTKQPDPPEDPPCPGPNAPRIGDVAQNQTEKVSGFELQTDPRNPDGVKICVTLYENIPGTTEQFLPSPQMAATTTATIAVVATSSALLAKPLADLAPEGCETCHEESYWEGSEEAWEETLPSNF